MPSLISFTQCEIDMLVRAYNNYKKYNPLGLNYDSLNYYYAGFGFSSISLAA